MDKLKYSALTFALLLPFIFFGVINKPKNDYKMSRPNVEDIIYSVGSAFDKAENEVFKIVPTPDEDIIRPDPDVNKCPCKGTGKIVHGDGHVTDCPFHQAGLIIKQQK